MRLIMRRGKIEIYEITESYGVEFYVYGVTNNGDPKICPSLGMAMEIAECAS